MLVKNVLKYINRFHRQQSKQISNNDFYKLSKTCQIPQLSALYTMFFGTTAGTFVEVGAYDGEYVSNTSGLADMGWNGHYIEPVTAYYLRCKKRHEENHNTKIYNIGIGQQDNEDKIINVSNALSTMSTASFDNFKKLEWASPHVTEGIKQKVTLYTLDTFLKENKVLPGFELLVVDVEGFEAEVFAGFSIAKWVPKMIIVELHDVNKDYGFLHEQTRILHLKLIENQYVPIYKDYTNCVYIQKTEYAKRQ
ncbi:FkbM family methyltransferase [Desulfocurvibacter africanus]|uniref:FkbM family methyltransferase n=1 Tax=Desulfocurvibacter africanus TaxID=873 RepID=UPI00040E680D|nr:FkbM family methyltransferase [Desulfocurvibacter africanus]